MTDLKFSEELFELVEEKRCKSVRPIFIRRMHAERNSKCRIVQAIEQSVVFDM